MSYFSENDLTERNVLEGVTLKAVSGNETMMTFFKFEPHAVIPSHRHPHEQITYVTKGEIEFTCEGETKILKAGDGIVITSNREHSARVMSGPAEAVDAWYPVREDYK